MTNWDEIREDYASTGATLSQLSKKYNVPLGTIKSQKSRDAKAGIEWARGTAKKDATIGEKDATKIKKVATKTSKDAGAKKGALKGRQKKGNPNPSNQFTKRNTAAVTHGLFSKYLHLEHSELLDDVKGMDLIDHIWVQIQLSFAAIIRAQKIMWVNDADAHLRELSAETTKGDEYRVIYAHERYEAYIRAQARAMAEYRNLVKQFLEMTGTDDERRLKLKQMQLNIKKTKAEIANIQGADNEEDDTFEIVVRRKESRDDKEAGD